MHPKRAARLLATLGICILLTVFIMRIFSMMETTMRRDIASAMLTGSPPVPAIGRYTISPDGMEVTFQQQTGLNEQAEWFHMPLAGGPITPTDAPVEDLRPFILRNGKVSVQQSGGTSIITGSPAAVTVTSYSRSPDGKSLAYGGHRADATGIYILNEQGHISWLGDFPGLDDLAWSPDGQSLAFIAPDHGVYEVFSIDRQGQTLDQLTRDGLQKRHPIWSPDGKSLAYQVSIDPQASVNSQATATPERLFLPTPQITGQPAETPGQFYLEQVNRDGTQPHRLTRDPQALYNIAWITHGAEIAYTLHEQDHPQRAYLFALNLATGKTRRVYPPYTITALDCPARIPRGGSGNVTLKLDSGNLSAAKVPLLLRSAGQPFSILGPYDRGDTQSRTADIQPQAVSAVTWTVQAVPGATTYVSALVLPGETFAMDEAHCRIENTAGLLPDLSFLTPVLPLTLAGMALCLPMLRNEKRRRYWVVWLAAPALIVLLLAIEIRLAGY